MLVGVASLPPSFPSSRTQAFYIIKRQSCLYFCNTVYISRVHFQDRLSTTQAQKYSCLTLISYYQIWSLLLFCLKVVFQFSATSEPKAVCTKTHFLFSLCSFFLPHDYKIVLDPCYAMQYTPYQQCENGCKVFR